MGSTQRPEAIYGRLDQRGSCALYMETRVDGSVETNNVSYKDMEDMLVCGRFYLVSQDKIKSDLVYIYIFR